MLGISVSGFDVVTDVVRNERVTEKSSNPMVGTWDYGFEPEPTSARSTRIRGGQASSGNLTPVDAWQR